MYVFDLSFFSKKFEQKTKISGIARRGIRILNIGKIAGRRWPRICDKNAVVPKEDIEQYDQYDRDNQEDYDAYPISDISTHLRESGHGPTNNALFDEFWHNFY